VAAARAAFPGWSSEALAGRQKVLNAMADVVEANAAALARLLTQEQGKPLAEASYEVSGTTAFIRYFAGLNPVLTQIVEDSTQRRVEIQRRPLGVVAMIVPWNFPLLILAGKMAPALLLGNTVVAKPAPTTPLTTLKLGELLADVLPPGVLNIIADANDLGDALTSHPDVRKISFTGSTATGRKVMASAADSLKRLTLELGGNDAAIVLSDVDPKAVAPRLFDSAFANNGQICVALKRLYVHESIYDAICAELVSLANAATVGNGLEAGTRLGPVQNKMQYEKLKELLADAKQHGTVIAGGTVPDEPGYFIRPTIVRDISDGTRLVDEEQFGPILPVIRFSDVAEVIRRANASPFGLGSSIWSADSKRACELAAQINAGTIWINKHLDSGPHIPFGGAKQSGIGVEYGAEGLAEYTQIHVVNAVP
jgi:acyl-CoA reductase-like NAD-dependent aldehyde dehydrogenase